MPTTAGLQLATAVQYSSLLNHWADSAPSYLAQDPAVIDFIRNKPVVWDETRVLPGSKIGTVSLMARRCGDTWYLSAINGTDQRVDRQIKVGFLGDKGWNAVSFSDVPGDKTGVSVTKSVVTRNEIFDARMEPGGGFVAVLTPVP